MFAETRENVAALWKRWKPKSEKKRGEGAAVAEATGAAFLCSTLPGSISAGDYRAISAAGFVLARLLRIGECHYPPPLFQCLFIGVFDWGHVAGNMSLRVYRCVRWSACFSMASQSAGNADLPFFSKWLRNVSRQNLINAERLLKPLDEDTSSRRERTSSGSLTGIGFDLAMRTS